MRGEIKPTIVPQREFMEIWVGEVADEAASEMEVRLHSNPDVRKGFQAAKVGDRGSDGRHLY